VTPAPTEPAKEETARASLARDHLIAVIDPRNAASVSLALRLGFVFDRDDVTPAGVVVTVYRLVL
jgi:RimJ/RimL family protein N-acetyltransferase